MLSKLFHDSHCYCHCHHRCFCRLLHLYNFSICLSLTYVIVIIGISVVYCTSTICLSLVYQATAFGLDGSRPRTCFSESFEPEPKAVARSVRATVSKLMYSTISVCVYVCVCVFVCMCVYMSTHFVFLQSEAQPQDLNLQNRP